MNAFVKKYHETCGVYLSGHGFFRRKNTYFRVIHDVVQEVGIEALSTPVEYRHRICFAVIPLSRKIDKEMISDWGGRYNLRSFYPNGPYYGLGEHWICRKEDADIELCMQEILDCLETYLLPFFIQADSCKTALPALISLEKDLYTKGAFCGGYVWDGKPAEWVGIDLTDTNKFYMALKTGDRVLPLLYLQGVMDSHLQAYQSREALGWLTEDEAIARKEEIYQLQRHIERFQTDGNAFDPAIIAQNETYSREALKTRTKSVLKKTKKPN